MKKRLPGLLLAMGLTLSLLSTTALAAGHRFVRTSEDPDDPWVCLDCGGAITADLKEGYDAVLALDGRILPSGVERTERAVRNYVEELVQNALDRAGWYTGTVAKVSYGAPGGGRDGAYSYTVAVQSYGRSNPMLTEAVTPTMVLIIPSLSDGDPEPDQSETEGSSSGTGWRVPGYTQPGYTVYPYGWNGWNVNYQTTAKDPVAQRNETLAKVLWYAWISRNHSTMSFTDVPRDSWFYSGVSHVWFNSLMSGVSEDRFAPDEPASRAMVWTVLARMSGVDVSAAEGQAWYEPGMAWAVNSGLANGKDPMGGVTREYLAEMLWKCAGGLITPTDLSGYSDSGKVSAYASNGVQWAVASGVLQGSDGKLSPQGGVTRAELANMVMRYQLMPR